MNIRKIIISVVGILLIVGSIPTFKIITKKKAPKEVVAKNITQSVVVEIVKNKDITVKNRCNRKTFGKKQNGYICRSSRSF